MNYPIPVLNFLYFATAFQTSASNEAKPGEAFSNCSVQSLFATAHCASRTAYSSITIFFSDSIPTFISQHASPGTTNAFSMRPHTSAPPTCSTLMFALSTSPFWNPAFHPSPSIVAAMNDCIILPSINDFDRNGIWPLSMHIVHENDILSESSSASDSSSSQPVPLLLHSVMGTANTRSSTCSDLLRAVNTRNPSLIFLLR